MTEPNDEDRAKRLVMRAYSLTDEGCFNALVAEFAAVRAAERERGSLALAACEAREAKWAALAKYMADGVCDCEDQIEGACAACFARALLSAPRDSEALKAIVLKALLEGGRWVARRRDGAEPLSAAGYAQEAADDRVEELGDPDDPDTRSIVASILSGGASE